MEFYLILTVLWEWSPERLVHLWKVTQKVVKLHKVPIYFMSWLQPSQRTQMRMVFAFSNSFSWKWLPFFLILQKGCMCPRCNSVIWDASFSFLIFWVYQDFHVTGVSLTAIPTGWMREVASSWESQITPSSAHPYSISIPGPSPLGSLIWSTVKEWEGQCSHGTIRQKQNFWWR